MLYIYAKVDEDHVENYEGEDPTAAAALLTSFGADTLEELRVNFATETADGEARSLRRDAHDEACDDLMADALAWLEENGGQG